MIELILLFITVFGSIEITNDDSSILYPCAFNIMYDNGYTLRLMFPVLTESECNETILNSGMSYTHVGLLTDDMKTVVWQWEFEKDLELIAWYDIWYWQWEYCLNGGFYY